MICAMWIRIRLPAFVAAVVIGVAGLTVRWLSDGAFAKYAGTALYAAFFYAVVVCLAPRIWPAGAGAIALAWCWAVEFAQLTPGPAALSARSVAARLVLGATFNAPDLAWYAVGGAAMCAAHAWFRGRR
jgi:hypothetical protein